MMHGGSLMTTEPAAPGFYINPHSINHFNITETPWYKDLGLARTVPYITPRYIHHVRETGPATRGAGLSSHLARADFTRASRCVVGLTAVETVLGVEQFYLRDESTDQPSWGGRTTSIGDVELE
jgi:hypothetical protein